MKVRIAISILVGFMSFAHAEETEHKWFSDVLIRYENETGSLQIKDRERLRVIAHAGVKSTWSNHWQTTLRLSTGLKNKQNVPAITVHRFSDQPQPDSDIFVDRAFVTGKFEKVKVNLGKIPWGSKQVTDIFWDRHLNPWGASVDYQVADSQKIYLAHFKPLDGHSDTVGDMTIVQLQSVFKWQGWKVAVMPWWVNYKGEGGAEYAKKDTALDNQFIRLSTHFQKGKWRLGADIGQSLNSSSELPQGEFNDQKSSYAFEIRHGSLKQPGSILTQLRSFKVERYAVVGEFAQNAVSRFATNNVKGWDLRVRRKMAKNWWLGMRYSDTETLVGNLERGKRFRIEGKYVF